MKLSRRQFLHVGLALTLGGCTTRTPEAPGKSEAASPDSGDLTVLMPGSSDAAACARISKRISEVTRSRLGFGVWLEQQPFVRYESALWQRLMQKQAPDLFYLSAAKTLASHVYENNVYPLDALLEGYPALYRAFTPEQWNSKRKYRRIYAVPSGTTDCYCSGFLARKDLLDALQVQTDQISSLQQLHELLLEVKKEIKDVIPVVPHYGQMDFSLGEDPLDDRLGVLLQGDGTMVQNFYASADYAARCQEMYQWRQEGLILQNACLRKESAVDLMRVCHGFGFFCRLNADTLNCFSRVYGEPLAAIGFGGTVQNSSGLPDGWALPVQPSRKKEALAFLEWLCTDPETAELFLCGEEEDRDPARTDRWWNETYGLLSPESVPGQTLPAMEEAIVSPAYGFSVNVTECIDEINRCSAAVRCYNDALLSGSLNPADALPLFLRELDAAGVSKIMAAKQQRLDDWLDAQ